jgi:hypothetical protein
MAEPALIVLPAAAGGSGRTDAASGACRGGGQAWPQWPVAAPPSRIAAEPEAGVDAPDYTAFSMVGVAG